MKLKILVGTMTSTADYVAQAIQMDCADLVDEIEVVLMDGLDISAFDEDALYLICSSTYGSGDVPDNARNLYDSLDTTPKYLGHVRYGVIALGDRTYMQTFCFGGKKFDERLQGLVGGPAADGHDDGLATGHPRRGRPARDLEVGQRVRDDQRVDVVGAQRGAQRLERDDRGDRASGDPG